MKRRGKDGLSNEDEALWAHVARSVTRMEQRRRANRPGRADDETDVHPKRLKAATGTISKTITGLTHPAPAVRPPMRSPGPGSIEPRKAKRVAKGRDEIEARIDLHGMRQAEAHGVLRGFLMRAHQSGLRMVLVITGKGRADDHDRHAPFDMFQDRDRGVLRRNVPRWLAEPDLSGVVVSFTTAGPRHGGEGAIYVHLRRGVRS